MISFPEFFVELWGMKPHPWQAELAEQVAVDGRWPGGVGAPTGLGKTACIDIAVWALACDVESHGASGRHQPLRIAFGVERRLVVDAAGQRAEAIAAKLEQARGTETGLGHVAAALEQLLPAHAEAEPVLMVSSLHGNKRRARFQRWERTAGAMVVTATMTQLTSRVLMRGVGESISRRSVAAGVLGTDCLRLCDEPHLSAPAVQTLFEQQGLAGSGRWALRGPQTVVLGATVPAQLRTEDRFVVDASVQGSRRANPPRRLEVLRAEPCATGAKDAARRNALGAAIAEAAKTEFAADAAARDADQAWIAEHGGGVVVLVSSIGLAVAVSKELAKGGKANAVPHRVVTSRVREADRTSGPVPDPTAIIVATQTLEVGVDFDARVVITDLAPLPSLIQRAGRCNRVGLLTEEQAKVVLVLGEVLLEASVHIYGREPLEATAQLLEQRRSLDVDAEQYEQVWSTPTRRVPLTEQMVDLLSDPRAFAPWEQFLTGLDMTTAASVRVCFRDELSLVPRLPVQSAETLELPIWALRSSISGTVRVLRVSPTGEIDRVKVDKVVAGDTVVLDTTQARGSYSVTAGWGASSTKGSPVIPDVHVDAVLDSGVGGFVSAAAVLSEADREAVLIDGMALDECRPTVELGRGWSLSDDGLVVEIPGPAPKAVRARRSPVLLADHLDQVSRYCEETARVAGLDEEAQQAHSCAGLHHDLGKAWDLFQQVRLGNPTEEPWAKSLRGQAGSGRDELGRWRHEAVVAARMSPGLPAWLVATHHGHGVVTIHGDEVVQVLDSGSAVADTDVWSLAGHSALMRSADWAASAEPEADQGLTLSDLDFEFDYEATDLGIVPGRALEAGAVVHRLTGLVASPQAGALAAYGVLGSVVAAGDERAALRLGDDGVFELSTSVPIDGSVDLWNSFFVGLGKVGKHNLVEKAGLGDLASVYGEEIWRRLPGEPKDEQDAEKILKRAQQSILALALIANNSSPAEVLSQEPEHWYQVLTDPSAGWEAGKAGGLDLGDRTQQHSHGAAPLVRPALLAWAGLGQHYWGQAQTRYGAGTAIVSGKAQLTLPMPTQWARAEQIQAMARRGWGRQLRIQEYVTSNFAWREVNDISVTDR